MINNKYKTKVIDIPMKTEEPEQIEDEEDNNELKIRHGSKKSSENSKEEKHESETKEISEEYKQSNKSSNKKIFFIICYQYLNLYQII